MSSTFTFQIPFQQILFVNSLYKITATYIEHRDQIASYTPFASSLDLT